MALEIHPWRTGKICVCENVLELVFVTKSRNQVLSTVMHSRLRLIFDQTCRQLGGNLIDFRGEHDYVHLRTHVPPTRALSDFIGKLKGKSAYILRREFSEHLNGKLFQNSHLWSPSYFAISSSEQALDRIIDFIEEQRQPKESKHIKKSLALLGRKKVKKIPDDGIRSIDESHISSLLF